MIIPNKFNGYGTDGRRLYHKGGDGGASQMRADEEKRQQRIKAAVDSINGIFGEQTRGVIGPDGKEYFLRNPNAKPGGGFFGMPKSAHPGAAGGFISAGGGVQHQAMPPVTVYDAQGNAHVIKGAKRSGGFAGQLELPEGYQNWSKNSRDVLYDQHKNAVFDLNKGEIDRQYTEAERQNRFGLARSGLMGGSVQIDSVGDIQDRTNKGLVQATAAADAAAAGLKTQDERARQSLISMAQSGIDTGTAQTMAMKQLDATAQSAAADRGAASIGNLFGDMSQAYLVNQIRQGQIAGSQYGQNSGYGVGNVRQGYDGQTY